MNNKDKNKMPKKIIIIIAILFIISILVFIILGALKKSENKNPSWEKIYYEYLNNIAKEKDISKIQLNDSNKNVEIGFINIEENNNPIMISHPEDDDESYMAYYIKNGTVENVHCGMPVEIKLAYNIDEEAYDYYIQANLGESKTYKKISERIKEANEGSEYQGKEIREEKDEDKFIIVDKKINFYEFNLNMKEKDIKKLTKKAKDNYIPKNKIITNDIKNNISNRLKKDSEKENTDNIEENNENIEIEENENVIDSKKLILNGHTLNYGTYIDNNAIIHEKLIINEDRTCTIDKDNCTWTIGTYNFSQDGGSVDMHQGIEVRYGSYVEKLTSFEDNEIGDGSIIHLRYVG